MDEQILIISELFKHAMRIFIDLASFHILILVFGVSVVLVFSSLYLWKHVQGAKP